MKKTFLPFISLFVSLASSADAQTFSAGYSASWMAQLGITAAIENAANEGQGFTIGIVDTGIIANNAEVNGRVSAASSCASVTFACSKGVTDDNGHGTATASIAAGSTANGGWMSGVAPKATIVAEKVLNASGSGYDTDVANGIIKAANAGAQVINLSLTYAPTSTIVNAINYAAGKGAIVVFAGGNSSAALDGGANSTGFTTAALSHLVFAGSVNSRNVLSSFSNTPGSGSAYAGSVRSSYSSLWLMAAGENIIAPGIMYGSNAYAYWSGTSMAAPEISGALALLETTWPVLARDGTATSVLFQTATKLGGSTTNTTYGNGLLNLTAAFEPAGSLTVTEINGKSVPVTSLTGGVLSSGALGSLSSISAKLSSYTALDSYQRNFLVNLSSLITSKPASAAQIVAGTQAQAVTGAKSSFADGSSFAYAYTETSFVPAISPLSSPGKAWYSAFTSASGTSLAMGQGFPGSQSFADTLWGMDSEQADAARALGVSASVLKLADGGNFSAYGRNIGADTRLAFSYSDTGDTKDLGGGNMWQMPNASAFSSGITTHLTDIWSVGSTFSYLSEQNGLLGTVYDNQNLLSLGNSHKTASIGVSSAFDIADKTGLLFEAALSRTGGGTVDNSLITDVSALWARSYGAALVTQNAWHDDDKLSLSVRKPLRVISGSADIATTGVDSNGYPTTSSSRASLVPTGSETNFAVDYVTPLAPSLDLTTTASLSQDAENVSGATAAGLHAELRLRF